MPNPDKLDPLRQMGDAVVAFCKEQSLQVFYAFVGGKEDRNVYWNTEQDNGCHRFLGIAKALDARLIYLDSKLFEDSQVEEALEMGDENKQAFESYRSKVGLVAYIELAFLYGGIFHIYQSEADWFREFNNLSEEKEAGSGLEDEVDPAVVNEWAEKLATEPRYATCKNKSQKKFLLEELAGDEFDELPEWGILEKADKIYFLKVKPKEDQRLKKEATKLRDQGLNMNSIAQKLGISRDRVSGLLAD